MLDILQLRVNSEELDRLRLCQTRLRSDCHAAFTAKGPRVIWPSVSWSDAPLSERINVRGWFPLLDKIADEFLIWRPQGGCFFVFRDRVTYRVAERGAPSILFLQLEAHRLAVVPPRRSDGLRAYTGA